MEMQEKLVPATFSINSASAKDIIDPKIIKKEIHNIHNYIRDNTKIQDESKGFFIAIILISVQKESFRKLIKKYNSKRYLYDIMIENMRDFDIDITVFEFLRNDSNNVHFLNIINKVINIYTKITDKTDLLNEFYTEFVHYYNTDSASLGIVLTPNYIVKLMVYMLNITPNDIILDLCAGTGSFLMEAWNYKPKMIIGCEFQNKLFALLKCNIILKNITSDAHKLIKGDCFESKFKSLNPTKSIINPPYGIACSFLLFYHLLSIHINYIT